MSRQPIPLPGFVPLDSDEAWELEGHIGVNYAFITEGTWQLGWSLLGNVRKWAKDSALTYYHIQIPPKVEWKEVWGLDRHSDGENWILKKNGKHVLGLSPLTDEECKVVKDALNEKFSLPQNKESTS